MNLRRPSLAAIALAVVLVACGQAAPSAPLGIVTATLLAGPVCPVETNPPDPACAARPVAGRDILLLTADGREAARGTSGADGVVRFQVPYGAYIVRAAPFDGFPTPPEDAPVVVDATPLEIELAFDTGIR